MTTSDPEGVVRGSCRALDERAFRGATAPIVERRGCTAVHVRDSYDRETLRERLRF